MILFGILMVETHICVVSEGILVPCSCVWYSTNGLCGLNIPLRYCIGSGYIYSIYTMRYVVWLYMVN